MVLDTKDYISHAISAGLLIASIWITVLSFTFKPTDAQCVESMFSWSPVSNVVKYGWRMFDSINFLAHSVYFDAEITEREAAWDGLLPSKTRATDIAN
jgi:hypothetical protein